jgi:hypothetical protein
MGDLMNGTWHQIAPVAISIALIILIAVLRSYSTTVAAITATMPLTVPLALWIVHSAEGGDRFVTIHFIESMIFGVLATLISVVAIWYAARAGWGLIGIIAACYATWAIVLGVYFVLRRVIT